MFVTSAHRAGNKWSLKTHVGTDSDILRTVHWWSDKQRRMLMSDINRDSDIPECVWAGERVQTSPLHTEHDLRIMLRGAALCWPAWHVTVLENKYLIKNHIFCTIRAKQIKTCFYFNILLLQISKKPNIQACFLHWCTSIMNNNGAINCGPLDLTASLSVKIVIGRQLKIIFIID